MVLRKLHRQITRINQGERAIPKQVPPFHSKTGEVYHIYSVCVAGRSIKRGRKVKGKGNKKLCGACKDIRVGKRPH